MKRGTKDTLSILFLVLHTLLSHSTAAHDDAPWPRVRPLLIKRRDQRRMRPNFNPRLWGDRVQPSIYGIQRLARRGFHKTRPHDTARVIDLRWRTPTQMSSLLFCGAQSRKRNLRPLRLERTVMITCGRMKMIKRRRAAGTCYC